MKMRKTFVYTLLAAAVSGTVLTSCEDMFGGFLDKQPSNELTEEETRIVKILSRDDLHINTLVVEANIPINRMSALLFGLEMKGVVKALVGGMYHLLA